MNQNSRLGSGIYLNFFPIEVPDTAIKVMTIARSSYPDLKVLRNDLVGLDIGLYADEDEIYGYGNNLKLLQDKGFTEDSIALRHSPRLAGRMILEGFLDNLKEEGYVIIEKKGSCEVFKLSEYALTTDDHVKVFTGFSLRSLFFLDHSVIIPQMVFGLVIDVTYAFKDKEDIALNMFLIRKNLGAATLSEVRRLQGDLVPTGINTEVARQRLLNHILPFVEQFPEFNLPGIIPVKLSAEPCRVILGGDNL